jgi:hypothetical protein
MMMFMVPAIPTNSPVPESGTTVTVSCGAPRSMIPRYALDGDISARTLHCSHAGQHLPFAYRFQVAMKLLVDEHAAEG